MLRWLSAISDDIGHGRSRYGFNKSIVISSAGNQLNYFWFDKSRSKLPYVWVTCSIQSKASMCKQNNYVYGRNRNT